MGELVSGQIKRGPSLANNKKGKSKRLKMEVSHGLPQPGTVALVGHIAKPLQ